MFSQRMFPHIGITETTTTTLSTLKEPNSLAESSTSTNVDSIKFEITGTSTSIKRKTKISPVWTYFQHFDLNYHPGMKHFRVCLVCRANGVDKAISVGVNASPGPLVSHLRTHNTEYLEYMEKKVKNAEISVTSASDTQSSIVSFFPQT